MKYFSVLLCISTMFSCGNFHKEKTISMTEKAKLIHEKLITIDTHNDIDVANFSSEKNYTQNLDTQINLPKMEEDGLNVSWLVVYTKQDSLTKTGYANASSNAMAKFNAIHRLCEEIAPDKIALAVNSASIRKITASNKKVAMIGVENAYPMGEDLSNFKKYYDLGARYISLSHNEHSQFCDSNTGEKDNIWLYNGLSELGKSAVKEMNRLGIMIDVSHVSKATMTQMIALSKAPILASHSSARALCNHSKNLDDEQLLLMKENGGVVQTVAFSSFLNAEKHEARAAYMKNLHQKIADSLHIQWYERSQLSELTAIQRNVFKENRVKIVAIASEKIQSKKDVPPAVDVSDFVNHIDYMVKLIGIDHVGISSDFDGGGGIEGWSDASETFNVTLELVKRGYTEEEIKKLWGANLMRVLDHVAATAKEIQNS